MQREPKPQWLRVRLPGGDHHHEIKKRLREKSLHTVCEEGKCPNIAECWGNRTATLMILGDTCTRGCRFCSVQSGNPHGKVDRQEPQKCAETVVAMGLSYVVLTCVDRDDLPDGGASHFAEVVRAIRARQPECRIEVLTSDYGGNPRHIETISNANPDVFAHNLETVRRLTPTVRDPRAGYDQSLNVLAIAKKLDSNRVTKSSLMLGLGESEDEVRTALRDLRRVGVDVVTLGQYLQPTRKQLPVQAFISPKRFDAWADEARQMGFLFVASGPLVRSSYRAAEAFLSQHVTR